MIVLDMILEKDNWKKSENSMCSNVLSDKVLFLFASRGLVVKHGKKKQKSHIYRRFKPQSEPIGLSANSFLI